MFCQFHRHLAICLIWLSGSEKFRSGTQYLIPECTEIFSVLAQLEPTELSRLSSPPTVPPELLLSCLHWRTNGARASINVGTPAQSATLCACSRDRLNILFSLRSII